MALPICTPSLSRAARVSTGWRALRMSTTTRYTVPGRTTLGASTRYVLAGTGNGTPHPAHGLRAWCTVYRVRGYRKWYTSPGTRYTTPGASTRYVLAGTGNGTPHPVHGTPRSEPAPGTSWRVQEMVHLTRYTVHHARSQHQVRPGGYRKWYIILLEITSCYMFLSSCQ